MPCRKDRRGGPAGADREEVAPRGPVRSSPAPSVALLVAVLLLVPCATAARADVIVVPPPAGTGALQAAVDAAADGDILLLPGGASFQGGTTIAAKSLTLVGDPDVGQSPPTLWHLVVRDLPAGGRVVLRGLTVAGDAPLGVPNDSLELLDDAGAVWVEDCTLVGLPGLAGFGASIPGAAGVRIDACEAVTMMRCEVLGGDGANGVPGLAGAPGSGGGAGALVTGSRVALHASAVVGGRGGHGTTQLGGAAPGPGGRGLDAVDARLLVAGGAVSGGQGGNAGGAGGDGLRLSGAGSQAILVDVVPAAGAGSGGPSGVPLNLLGGTVLTPDDPARTIEVSAPVREQQPGHLVVTGAPDELAGFFLSFSGDWLELPGKGGVLSIGAPLLGPFLLGPLPAPDGVLDIPFVAPDLMPASLPGQVFLLQLLVHDGQGVRLGGTTSFVLIDQTIG